MAFWVQKMPLCQICENRGKIGTVFIMNCNITLLQYYHIFEQPNRRVPNGTHGGVGGRLLN